MTNHTIAADKTCDLCGDSDFELIAHHDRHGKPLDTAICRTCGLVVHAQIPTDEELQQFYAGEYRREYHGEATPSSRRVMRAWINGQRIQKQLSTQLQPGSSVLEVGAGIGCTVKAFELAGHQAGGIDPGDEFLDYSKSKLNADVRVASLADLPASEDNDIVLLVHVIEHLRSPRASLNHIRGLIKPGGLFYVECPNLQAPFARRSRLFHSAHIHNFVPSTLSMLAQQCGYEPVQRFGTFNDPNLQMLFRRTDVECRNIDADNYKRTIAELDRSNLTQYTLTPRYIGQRLRLLAGYAHEYLTADRFVANVIRKCEHTPMDSGVSRTHRRAA